MNNFGNGKYNIFYGPDLRDRGRNRVGCGGRLVLSERARSLLRGRFLITASLTLHDVSLLGHSHEKWQKWGSPSTRPRAQNNDKAILHYFFINVRKSCDELTTRLET